MPDLVKVYIYEPEYENPYWDWSDTPLSPAGDMFRYSERHAYMIPREQYERWIKAMKVFNQIQQEIETVAEGGKNG